MPVHVWPVDSEKTPIIAVDKPNVNTRCVKLFWYATLG